MMNPNREQQPDDGGRRARANRRRLLGAAAAAAGTAAGCGPGRSGMWPGGGAAAGDWDGDGGKGSHGLTVGGLAGRLAYTGDANIWVWEKGNARRVTSDRLSRQPAWSPDGKHIAHVKIDVSSSELWVMDADGANSRQLTRNTNPILTRNNWAFRPIWWPDGSRLLFLSEETTNDLMLWQIGLDGKNRRPFLTVPDMEGGIDMPSLAPDGKRMALVTYRGPGVRSQVWTYALPNGPWRQLTDTPNGAYDPVWSPDGAQIAYTVREKERHDVWVMGADGSNPQPVTQNGVSRAPRWSPDGRFLAFISGEAGLFEACVTNAPGPRSEPAAGTPAAAQRAGRTAGGKVPAALQLTRGALLDPVSGLSWTK